MACRKCCVKCAKIYAHMSVGEDSGEDTEVLGGWTEIGGVSMGRPL